MKKWIAMLLAALMVFSMAACAAKNEPAADQTNDQTAADTQTSKPAEDTASAKTPPPPQTRPPLTATWPTSRARARWSSASPTSPDGLSE